MDLRDRRHRRRRRRRRHHHHHHHHHLIQPYGILEGGYVPYVKQSIVPPVTSCTIGWLGHERPDSVRQRFVEATGNKNEI